jgi:putative transposase
VADILQETIQKYGVPGTFNTDQGSQYTSRGSTNVLNKRNKKISMDGKGEINNIFY